MTTPLSHSPERRLWQAVITRAVWDGLAEEPSRDKREADAWIRDFRSSFREACAHAGYDPNHIREQYLAAHGLSFIELQERQRAIRRGRRKNWHVSKKS